MPSHTAQASNIKIYEICFSFKGVDHLLNALRKLKVLRKLMKAVLQKKCSQDAKCLERYKFFDLKHKKSEITRPKSFEWVTVSTGCSVTCGIGTCFLLISMMALWMRNIHIFP